MDATETSAELTILAPAGSHLCRPYRRHGLSTRYPGGEAGEVLFNTEDDAGRIGNRQPISFWCDDVMATAQALKSKGVAFAMEPKKEEWGPCAIFKDQDGNQFVLSSR